IDGANTYGAEEIIVYNTIGTEFVYADDFDNDNDIDVVSVSTGDDTIAWYRNNDGLGDFSEQLLIVTNIATPLSMLSVDIDNDGDFDVVSSSYSDGKVTWLENLNGLGNFSLPRLIAKYDTTFGLDGNEGGVFSEDLDSDGDYDILSVIYTDSEEKLVWFENLDGE